MPSYQYQALESSGRMAKGLLDAESEFEARKILREMRFDPLQVEPARQKTSFLSMQINASKLPLDEIALFTRQLATLVNSGLPLDDSLKLVGRQSRYRPMRNLVASLREQVSTGESFETALQSHSKSFGSLYIASVAAGESTGRLGQVLEQLACYLEKQSAHRRAIASALVYPIILILLASAIVAALMAFVVPNILEVVISSGQSIPSITQVLIYLTDFAKLASLPIFLTVLLMALIWNPALKRFGWQLGWHRLLLKTPLTRHHLSSQISARYASTLGLLTSTGIAVTDAMLISARVTDNLYAQEKLEVAAKLVSEGLVLKAALEKTELLPDFLVQLIGIGEQSGELPQMLTKGAVIIEDELQRNAQIFAKALEPATLILMGFVVLFIVMGVMLPIVNLSSVL